MRGNCWVTSGRYGTPALVLWSATTIKYSKSFLCCSSVISLSKVRHLPVCLSMDWTDTSRWLWAERGKHIVLSTSKPNERSSNWGTAYHGISFCSHLLVSLQCHFLTHCSHLSLDCEEKESHILELNWVYIYNNCSFAFIFDAIPLPELYSADWDTFFMRFFPLRASKMALIFKTTCKRHGDRNAEIKLKKKKNLIKIFDTDE